MSDTFTQTTVAPTPQSATPKPKAKSAANNASTKRVKSGPRKARSAAKSKSKTVTDKVKAGSAKLAENAKMTAADAQDRSVEALDTVKAHLESAYTEGFEEGRKYYRKSVDTASDMVRENPLATTALAFAGGLLIGALIKRPENVGERLSEQGRKARDAAGHYRDEATSMARNARSRASDMLDANSRS